MSAPARWAAGLLRVRWIVRLPILLYRLRLGALLGHRFLMLEHIGRSSGRRRQVVLEVIDHPAPGTWIVVSGFGERAQWLRNLDARPAARIRSGGGPQRDVTARRLGTRESQAVLGRYAQQHPRAWSRLRPVLEHTLGAPISDGALPMVELTRS